MKKRVNEALQCYNRGLEINPFEIPNIKGFTKESSLEQILIQKIAVVEIVLFNGKDIIFKSNNYKRKEFSRKGYVEMFLNLFDINFKFRS